MFEDFDLGLDMQETSIRIFVRKNGSNGGVQELRIAPGTKLSDLLEKAGKALGLERAKCAFHSNGVECTDVAHVDDKEVIFISVGEAFKACERQGAGGSQIVGSYLVQEKLGQGGFGSVFKGVHLETGEVCAVKFVPKNSFSQISDLQQVFQEIQSLRNLKHQNIISILGMADQPDSVCFFMEFAAGGELRGYVEKKHFLSEDESRHFFKQIARAVHYIHNKKIIHRDLKLENILLDDTSPLRCKIVDFGLSGYVAPHEKTVTDAGTEAYLAPEVYDGSSTKSDPYKLDVWAMGVILFALAHGFLPFRRPDKETCQKLAAEELPVYKEETTSRFRHLCKIQLTPKPAKRASVDKIQLDPWVTNNRFAACDIDGSGDEGENPFFPSQGEEPDTASVNGDVLDETVRSTASGSAGFFQIGSGKQQDRLKKKEGDGLASGSQMASGSGAPSGSPSAKGSLERSSGAPSPTPAPIRSARSQCSHEEDGNSPRPGRRRPPGKGNGNEKALMAAGAQMIGKRSLPASRATGAPAVAHHRSLPPPR